MKVLCPRCNTVYSISRHKINFHDRKATRCIKCNSRFYIERQEEIQKGDKNASRITLLQSYFEKRKGIERRKSHDRRNKIDRDDLPFIIPSKDFIPIFDNSGRSFGYFGPGRRMGGDRRNGIERRRSLSN